MPSGEEHSTVRRSPEEIQEALKKAPARLPIRDSVPESEIKNTKGNGGLVFAILLGMAILSIGGFFAYHHFQPTHKQASS